MDKTKKIKDIRVEVVKDVVLRTIYYTDGSKDIKVVENDRLEKLSKALLTTPDNNDGGLRVLKGGKR